MKFVEVEVQARLRALVAVEDDEGLNLAAIGEMLPLSNPALYQAAEVVPGTLVVTASSNNTFQAGIHQYKVVMVQEFGSKTPRLPRQVEVIAASRTEAFGLMKSIGALASFSRVEVHNLAGGVEARMLVERAGHGVVAATSGKVIASRLTHAEALTRFAQELAKAHTGGLHLVDFRNGTNEVLASAG